MPNKGVVFLYGEITMKCKSCIHANKVNEQLIHCNYFRCVKEDGWIADKGRDSNMAEDILLSSLYGKGVIKAERGETKAFEIKDVDELFSKLN